MDGAVVYSAWDAGFLLFREGLEALLVIAALVAFLNRAGQKTKTPWVWAGATAGLAASVGVAAVVSTFVAALTGEFTVHAVEAVSGMVAVILMLSVVVWLHGKAMIPEWNIYLKGTMAALTTQGSLFSRALLGLLAVLRDGGVAVGLCTGLAAALTPRALVIGLR